MGAGFPTPRALLRRRLPLPKRCGRQGFGLGCCSSLAKSAIRPARRLQISTPKGSRFLINGEPTDNRLALASKGALRAVFRATGKMAHSAYPELGESAVHKLVEVMAKLLELELPVTEDVGPSTLNIGQIHGGHAPNVIADKAEAQVLVRLVGDSAPVRAALLEAAAGLAEVDFTLEIPFVRLRAVEGLPTMIAKFTTDIPQLSNWGEPLLLGPGNIHVAHTPFEKLAKKELLEAVELYIEGGEAAACLNRSRINSQRPLSAWRRCDQARRCTRRDCSFCRP